MAASFYASFYFYVFLFVADAVASKVPVTEEETAGLLQLQPVEPLEALEAPVAQTFYGPAAAPGQFWYPPFLPPQTQFAQLSPSWENRRGDRETWTAGPYGQSEMKLHRFAGGGDLSHGDHPLTGPLLTRPAPVPAPAMVPAMVPAVPAVPDSPSSPTIATAPAVPVAAPAVPSVLSSGLRTERQERFAGGGSTGTAGTAAGSAAGAATARVDPREVFANGAARFAGGGADGGLHGLHTLSLNGFAGGSSRGGSDGSGSLGVFPGALPGESGGSVPMFGAGSALPGDSRKTWEPLPPKTLWSDPLQGTWRDQHVFASGMETKPKAENTAGNTAGNTPSGKTPDDDDDETYSVDCGTTVFQPKDWHFTFRPPNTGDFNIPIAVHQSPHQKSYQIARMEVSVNADLDNWQPFQLRLIAPSRTSILLKESGTSECADLRCEFTELNSCHSCTRPKEQLSAFVGESALGTWMVAFEDKEGRKRTGLMAWAALKITWSCEPPIAS